MPYWTSSRVGPIIGRDVHNKKKKKKDENTATEISAGTTGSTASSRRGITMEDLKKQTALRLAQEQQPSSSSSSVSGGKAIVVEIEQEKTVNSSEESFSQSITTTTSITLSADVEETEHGTTVVSATPPPATSSSGHRLFRSSSQTKPHRAVEDNLVSSIEKKYTTPTKSGFFFSRSSPQTHIPSSATTMKHPPPPSRSLFFTSASHGRNHHQNANTASIRSTVIASRTAIDTSTATEKGTNAKLPHGLTVSELKQMTRARLEAEATSSSTHSAPDVNPMMTSDYHHHTHVHPTYMNSTDPSPTRRSPYPMIYETTSDTWETASVSTTCTSEFLYPMVSNTESNRVNNNDVSVPFARTLSYPDPNRGSSPHPTLQPLDLSPVTVANHHYGNNTMYHAPTNHSNIATNRSRALTSSPRLGIPATYRPGHDTEDHFSYDSNYPTMRHHNSDHGYSNTIFTDQDALQNYYTGSIGGHNHYNMTMIDSTGNIPFSYESFNRCRTSSLPSVLIPTTENSDPSRNNSDFGNILCRPANHLSAVNERTPSSDKSNVYVAGLSDAFQSPQVSSFTSFYPDGNHNDGSFGNDTARNRASTWSNAASSTSNKEGVPTIDQSSLFLFGDVGINTATAHSTITESTDLSDDLASILKLATTSSLSSQHQMDHHDVRCNANITTDERCSTTTLF